MKSTNATRASGIFLAVCSLTASQAIALEAEWGDLHARCETAVTTGERLDVSGLREMLPNVEAEITENDVFGYDLRLEPFGPGGRTLPTGIWMSGDNRLELWLIEYPTKAGFRAVCEVRDARIASGVSRDEAEQLRRTFQDINAETDRAEIAVDNPQITAFRFASENARGCPVVTSFSADPSIGYLRSSVSEAAGVPTCGGPSLARNLLTPHGVLPSNVQGG